jgi:hypothetical protein
MTCHAHRRGAALILAIIILLALLLLGVPFLALQSAGVGGARNFAHRQLARAGIEAGETAGVAAGIVAIAPHLKGGGTEAFSTIPQTVEDILGTGAVDRENENRFRLQLDAEGLRRLGLAPNPRPAHLPLIAVTIADESGKLDPNTLSEAGWDALLRATGIPDWDDSTVADTEPSTNHRIPSLNPEADDADPYGELARMLADLPRYLPNGRVVRLEQLLLAGRTGYSGPLGGNNGVDGGSGFRAPLTLAELARLQPYLTLWNPAQARDGHLDLGTVVARVTRHLTRECDMIMDSSVARLLAHGTKVINHDRSASGRAGRRRGGAASPYPEIASVYAMGGRHRDQGADPGTVFRGRGSNGYDLGDPGDALGILAPPALNVHHLTHPVRQVLADLAQVGNREFRTYSDLRHLGDNALAFDLLSPVSQARLMSLPEDEGEGVRPDPLLRIELPPLDIHSTGVIQVDTAALMTDGTGRPTTQLSRSRIIQAVRQERVSERRWLTQGQHQANADQRLVANLDTFPHPINRLDQGSHERSWPADEAATVADGLLAAATQENLATGFRTQFAAGRGRRGGVRNQPSHLTTDVRLAFGGAGEPLDPRRLLVAQPGDRAPVVGGQGDPGQLEPDGYRIDGPIAYAAATLLGDPTGPSRQELGGRHLSLWLRPAVDWDASGPPRCIIEARTPAADLPRTWGGAAVPGDGCNNLGLYYDGSNACLVLAWAPPSIPWTDDARTQAPPDDPASFFIDECSGGSAQPAASDLFPPQPSRRTLAGLSQVAAPNRIVTLYKTPPRDGRPHFRKDQWYHLQIALSAPRHGEVAVLVDGIIGRDAARMTSPALTQLGDHITLPGLPLATALPPERSGDHLGRASVTVQQVAGITLTASDLYPARGMLRIGDEFLSYERVAGNTFSGVLRGRRQDTNTMQRYDRNDVLIPESAEDDTPRVQGHPIGTPVATGDYRLRTTDEAGTIYRGGCSTAHALGAGDPDPGTDPDGPGPNQWRIWAAVDPARQPVTQDPDLPDNPDALILDLAQGIIPLAAAGAGQGVADQFPERGIIQIRNGGQRLGFYVRKSGMNLTSLEPIPQGGWTMSPDYTGTNLEGSMPWTSGTPTLRFRRGRPPEVRLLSLEARATPRLDEQFRYKLAERPEVYDDTRHEYGARDADNNLIWRHGFYMQIRDPGTSRLEWIAYNQVLIRGNEQYVVHANGWYCNPRDNAWMDAPSVTRGLMRTDHPGHPGTTLGPESSFSDGALLEPVQTELGTARHWFASGDVLTLVPKDRLGADDLTNGRPGRPIQYLVRFAASDGYDPAGDQPNRRDATNGYLTFLPRDREVTPVAQVDRYEFLMGAGWGGVDLGPGTRVVGQPRGAWPRFDMWGGDAGRVWLLGGDPAADPALGEATGMIDGLCGGPQWGADADLYEPRRRSGQDGLDAGPRQRVRLGSTLRWIRGDALRRSPPNDRSARMFLALVGGAGMALAQDDDGVRVIGEGLLDADSEAPTVLTGEPTRATTDHAAIQPALPVCILPLGPVRTLAGNIDSWIQLTQTNGTPTTLDAPVALILDNRGRPDGVEAVALVGPRMANRRDTATPSWGNLAGDAYLVPTWLRGIYATPEGRTGQDSIVVGWWPRYAPALPAPAACTSEHHRCRTYTWAGFPLHLINATFDPGLLTGIAIASADLHGEPGDLFQIQARALAEGTDWPGTAAVDLAVGGNDLSGCFGTGQFNGTVTAGAELRLSWHYRRGASADLADLADAMNRVPPRIGQVRLRCLAPVKILTTRDAR